jgi:hypothetical protein
MSKKFSLFATALFLVVNTAGAHAVTLSPISSVTVAKANFIDTPGYHQAVKPVGVIIGSHSVSPDEVIAGSHDEEDFDTTEGVAIGGH